jgi:hypothetical protein
MIHGAHVVIYSKDSEADRAFFRDVLKYESVDPGHGWLIFALPRRLPAEAPLATVYTLIRPDELLSWTSALIDGAR